MEPGTLRSAARDLEEPATVLAGSASILDGVHVRAHLLGEAPAASGLSRSVNQLVGAAADSLRTGSSAVRLAADLLQSASQDYSATDHGLGAGFTRLTPR